MDIKYSQMKQLAEFSNDKIVNIIKNKIAESENAAVALVFDDQLIVLNEENDDFYTVNYSINKNGAIKLTNWEKVNLTPDNETKLESVVTSFFDPLNESEITVADMVNAFQLKFSNEPIKQIINTTHIEKKRIVESNARIKALKEVRKIRKDYKDDISELFEDEKINSLFSLISENGAIQRIVSRIDFTKPISVSLFEEISDKVVSLSPKKVNKERTKNIKEKVKNLWTSETFKEDVKELVSKLEEENAIGNFVKQHKEVLLISESELEDLIVKTTLMIGEAEITEKITKLFNEYYSIPETKILKEEYVSRNNIHEEEMDNEDDYNIPDEDKEEDKKDDDKKESSIDEDSINKILKVLNKIKEQLEDKTLENKFISNFISTLEDAKVGSIPEGKLKEILDFLNSIKDRSEEEDEE